MIAGAVPHCIVTSLALPKLHSPTSNHHQEHHQQQRCLPYLRPNLSFLPLQPYNFSPTFSSTIRISATAEEAAADMPSPSSSTARASDSKPFAVLFVCLGNICRSPAAEGVFRSIVKQKGLVPNFTIDSAGTSDYHEGNEADPRMKAASKRRGIEITSISRPLRPSDFRDFDLVLAMDLQNKDDILEAFNRWKIKESLLDDAYKKVELMCSYCKKHKETKVPDPYYGGPQGFEKVLDLLEDACGSLLDSIVAENKQVSGS